VLFRVQTPTPARCSPLERRIAAESNLPSHLRRHLRKPIVADTPGEVHFIRADEGAAQYTSTAFVALHTAPCTLRGQAGVLAAERIRRFHADVIKVLYPKRRQAL